MSESDLDRLYRRASAADPARPGAAARNAILDQARQLAAQAQQSSNVAPARASRWRTLLQGMRWQFAAPVAAALLAGILLAPQWRSGRQAPPARQMVADKAAGATRLQQTAPASADIERAPPAVPAAAPAPAPALLAPAPPSAPPSAPAMAQNDAFRRAAGRENLEQARVLQKPSLAINARDANGRTALMVAVMQGQVSLVRELLARGADPNIADARGRTPLAVARQENQRQLIDTLVAAGAR